MFSEPVLFILFLVGALWAISVGLLDKARAMMNATVGFCRDRTLPTILLLLVVYWVTIAKGDGEVTADTRQAQGNGERAIPKLLTSFARISVVPAAFATLVVGYYAGTRYASSTGQQCQLGAHGALPADETSEEHQPPGTLTMSRGPTPTPQPQTPR